MPRKASRHLLDLTDRGAPHRHRYQASCSCGWRAIPFRNLRTAERELHRHADNVARAQARALGRRPTARPRPVTPADQLPPEFQPKK